MKTIYHRIFLCSLLLILTACSVTAPVETLPATPSHPSNSPTESIPTNRPTITPAPSATDSHPDVESISNEMFAAYDALPMGLYLLVLREDGIYAVSPDGKSETFFANASDMEPIGTSVYQFQFRINDNWFAIDFNDRTAEEVQYSTTTPTALFRATGKCAGKTILPNHEWCVYEDQLGELYAASVSGDQIVKLSGDNIQYDGMFTLSPDGRWIGLFAMDYDGSYNTHLYMIDMSCLQEENACPSKTFGPFYDFNDKSYLNLTWSHDNQQILIPFQIAQPKILLFDSNSFRFRRIDIPINGFTWDLIEWAPDDSWILARLFDHDKGEISTYLIRTDDLTTFVTTDWFLGWLSTYPATEIITGQTYKITGLGNHLNLRAEPSLNAGILQVLNEGDALECLEGPVEQDGYTWWKFRAPSGDTGWAVEHANWYIQEQQ